MNTNLRLHSFSDLITLPLSTGQSAILDGQKVYIKAANDTQESYDHLANEILTLTRIKSIENILYPIDCLEESKIIFPYINYSLLDYCSQLSELEIIEFVLTPLLRTLKEIHSRNIIHADIKLENIRIDDTKKIFLSDFGRAKSLENFSENIIVSLSQHQPADMTHSPMYDLFSVGVLTYQLLFGLEFMRDFQLKGRKFENVPESARFSNKIKNFISIATDYDAANRFKSASHALDFILESGEPGNPAIVEKYNLQTYFETYLEFMKKTFLASNQPLSKFNDFIGRQGLTYFQRLKRWSESPDAMLIHLKRNKDIVGILECTISKNGTGFISTLFIREEFRGQGFAEILETSAFNFFSARNCCVAYLNVDKNNLRAQNFYKKSGWGPSEAKNYPNSVCLEKKIENLKIGT